MSAETLRRAAAKMRERAVANDTEDSGGLHAWFPAGHVTEALADAAPGWFEDDERRREALLPAGRHIASWSPVVALAVADWLDAEASAHIHVPGSDREKPVYDMPGMDNAPAVNVARAYLGEE